MKINNARFSVERLETVEDGMAVMRQFADALPYTLTDDQLTAYVQKQMHFGAVFCTRYRGEIVSMIAGYANNQETKHAFVTALAIREGMGVMAAYAGRETVKAFAMYAQENGMETIDMEVQEDNTRAKNIYCKVGAREVGRAEERGAVFMEISVSKVMEFFRFA